MAAAAGRLPEMARFAPGGPLGMGGAPLGNLFAAIPNSVAMDTLQAAWDSGMRTYDTAPFYGFGLSEQRFGVALSDRPRDEYVLCSKVGRLLDPDANAAAVRFNFYDGLPFQPRFDYSADAALKSIEASLTRMKLDRLDIVLIHDVSEDTHGPDWEAQFEVAMTGAAVALTRLREEGVIRAWGLGVNLSRPCLLALERADPDVFLLAGRYTLLDHASLDDLLPACAARGVNLMIGGPYNSGLLAGGSTFDYETAPPALVARVRALETVCSAFGVPLKAVALQFCAAHPVVATVIPGARSRAELEENVAMMRLAVPPGLWAALKQQGLIPGHAPTPQ